MTRTGPEGSFPANGGVHVGRSPSGQRPPSCSWQTPWESPAPTPCELGPQELGPRWISAFLGLPLNQSKKGGSKKTVDTTSPCFAQGNPHASLPKWIGQKRSGLFIYGQNGAPACSKTSKKCLKSPGQDGLQEVRMKPSETSAKKHGRKKNEKHMGEKTKTSQLPRALGVGAGGGLRGRTSTVAACSASERHQRAEDMARCARKKVTISWLTLEGEQKLKKCY